ncbi:ABC transporter permease [Mesorhizobium sp.]|uniref:ABC transporter permease n=1 Tax=Mesorhizobium sp. TaxID=1871066 RepID=UPI000FE4B705|nr:ABC transporter permease [Mesorhizobium sp.]RWI16503.1 MAG: ABC transporter permease [Mesorhizobium sp.]RWN06269.1 MAG: ABC transporter permease [Mesorhizobium sp.]RWN08232.1 MAG: ABC transporter permease [Mesorhizobium sp.]TIQ97621.1 MAG: ABC transporter permease [Mesorhizobium sp.]
MNTNPFGQFLIRSYLVIFLFFLLAPLAIMGGAALNDAPFPSVYPWTGFTDRWFIALWNDDRMWIAVRNTVLVAISVVVLAVPVGTAAAILVNSVAPRVRGFLYGVMVAPILTPGVVIGISTLLFWNSFSVPAGLWLSALGQVSYIAAYVMLLVLARLQSFDHLLEEAALDLGASHFQVVRRILLPHLYPALGAGVFISFFQSVENFNVTLFTRGYSETLTIYIFSQVRAGISPVINALAFGLIILTIVGAVLYEFSRQRVAKRRTAKVGAAS